MGYDAKTERLISLKKLAGKAQTSNDKGLANEGLPSGLTVSSNTVFGQAISTSPGSTTLYEITGFVEYLRFPVVFIAGSDTSSGRHGFELKLPSDYETNSTNPNKGSYPFKNNQVLNITSGSLQLIPPSYSTSYEAKPFYGGTSAKDSGTQIPILDARDWYMDYFNGIMFQQDPPGTGDHSNNPDYVEAYLYIGKYLDAVVSQAGSSGGADPNAQYLVLTATGSLANERVINPGTGLNGNDGGAGNNYTLSIDNSVVATLTGSQFSGNVGVTGSFTVGGKPVPGVDTNFFVSGSVDSRGTAVSGTSVFGGDVAISGTLAVNLSDVGVGSQFVVTTDGKVGIGTSDPAYKLSVGGNMEVGEYIYHKNDANTFIRFQEDQVHIKAGNRSMIRMKEDTSDQVLILSGGGVTSPDSSKFADTNFFVSGAIGSRGGSSNGTSVFGGDLVISGASHHLNGISGSLQRLIDGTAYLTGSGGIGIMTASNGQITISGSEGRIYTAGTGLSLTSNQFSINNSVVATLTGSQFSGNIGVTGSLGVLGDVEVAQYIKHIGDDDTFIQFADDAIGITAGGEQLLTISEAGTDMVTVGDGGDVDFRVRTENDDNTLYIEGSTDRIGIGTNSPSSILHIKEAGPTLTFQRENNSNASTIDFLGAMGNTANSIIHDSSTNDLVFKTFNGSSVEEILRLGDHYGASVRQVTILSGANMPPGTMQPRLTSDIAFFVSGSINSIGTSTRGASVFGGDVLTSGSITAVTGLTGSLTSLKNGMPYLRSGTGISITTGSLGEVTISRSSSGVTRDKKNYVILSDVNALDPVNVTNSDMSTVNYDPNLIDVYVNGQMMMSGSSSDVSGNAADYYVSTSTSLRFGFKIRIDDVLTVTILKI